MLSTKTVNYATEIDALMNVLLTVVQDLKAGRVPAEILVDLLPKVVAALGGVGMLSDEIKDPASIENSVALKLVEILNVLVK